MAVSVMSCHCLHHTQTHRHVSALCPRAELGGGGLTPPRNRGRTHFECQPSPDIHSFIHSFIDTSIHSCVVHALIDGSMDRWIDPSVKFSFLIESARALEQCFGTFGSISRSPFCSWRCRGHSMHPCIQPSSHDRVPYTARAHARIAAAQGEVTIVMDGIQWMAFTQQDDLELGRLA